jgi:hypothetical protein
MADEQCPAGRLLQEGVAQALLLGKLDGGQPGRGGLVEPSP